MSRRAIRSLVFDGARVIIAVVLAAILAHTAAPAQQRKASEAESPDAFLTGKPLTLEQIIEAAAVIYEGRLRQAIEGRGLTFAATPEALRRLRKSGVSEELMQVISRLAGAAPEKAALPKEPPRAGALTIACAPGECEVLINGISQGSTQGGTKQISGLPAGRAFLDVKKEGYEGQQVALMLEAGASLEHRVKLLPTLATQEKFGSELFARVIEALGGESGLQAARTLTAAGSAAVSDPAGARTNWTLLARLQLPNLAFWELRSGGVEWWVGRNREQSRAGGSRKLRNSPVVARLEKTLREWLALQPAAVVEAIRSDKMRLLANAAASTGPEGVLLRAEGAAGVYTLTVDPDLTLRRVVYETNSAPNSRVEAAYSDYRSAGVARYPMVWKAVGDSSEPNIEIRLNRIESNAKLRERDFRK